MDPRGLPMYQHPSLSMMRHSDIGSVSIPINHQMGNLAQENVGIQGAPMYHNHVTFTPETHPANLDKIPEQQNCSQLSLQREFDNERRCDVLPENPAHPPIDVNNARQGEIPLEDIKTEEEEDISNFMVAAHDIFLKIGNKELTIKEASSKLGRPYSFVYSRYQEFCTIVTGKGTIEKKKKTALIKKGKKKKRKKKLTTKGRSSGEKIFQCEDCPATFNTAYLIREHSKVHLPNNESHQCTACGIVFSKVFHLMKHRIEAHEEALQCPHCEKSFTIIASYKYHVRSHSGLKPFVCDECGKRFTSKANLKTHYRNHTGERPFMCGYCEKTFTSLNNLNDHLYVHTGGGRKKPKKIECQQCGYKCRSNSELEQHMNTHTGAKPYACDLCGSRFNFQHGLNIHKLTHTGVKPFKCQSCPSAFNQPGDLERHMMSHTGRKPFKCHLCDFSCTRKLRLEYHINTHTKTKPFKCDFYGCTAEYAAPTTLKHHKLSHGPPPPKVCSACNAELPDQMSLKQHMIIHTSAKANTCNQCFKAFYDEFSLKQHMQTHMEKPPGHKTKKDGQRKRNPGVKRAGKFGNTEKNWPSKYQAPAVAENGQSSIAQSWTINAEDTKSQSQFQSFAASQYSNLVNNAWPSAMDAEELRLRLISSFK